jgi:hypothetical protein
MSTDLTAKEQNCVRAALQFLRHRCGGWKPFADALGVKSITLARMGSGQRPPSARVVLRVARLASVGVDDVLSGRFPAPGTCPHCGNRPVAQADVLAGCQE